MAQYDQSISLLVKEDTNMQDAFQIIDREVNKYQNYIVALWKRRNSYAPISRLPPEMLCKIFAFASENKLQRPLHWIRVSYVCHEWRNIAVSSPSLWTNLPILNARWTEEMLSRSKMASLTVNANFSSLNPKFPVQTLSTVLRHTSRIRHLSLSNSSAPMIQKLLSGLPKSAPRLESLGIHVTRLYNMSMSPHPDEVCELPENVLCKMDRLRQLEVTRCKINWDSHLWNSLTCLKVHDTPLASRPTTAQLWDALNRMPHLESIDFQDTLPVVTDTSRQPRQTIFFPHLQKIAISSSTLEVERFLQGISFSPTVFINVVCKSTTASGSDFTGVLSAISSIVSPSAKSSGMNIRSFEVSKPSPGLNGLRFRAYTKFVSDFDMEYKRLVPNLDLSLSRSTATPAAAEKILKDVCGAIPLENLVNLHLCPAISFTPRILVKTFGQLAHLRSVHTTGVCFKDFALALQETRKQKNMKKSRKPPVHFRSLRSISMSQVNFDEDQGDLTIDALQDCLIWRYEHGVEVLELTITECYGIMEDEVSLLEDIVVNVEWDGVEMEMSDDGLEDDNDEEDNEDDDSYDSEYDYPFW